MDTADVKRKLAVILAADFEDYSRLMHEDEDATLRTLQAYREIIDNLIVRHAGRIFNTAGDSVVAEFASAIEAVRCGIAIQEELAPRNAELPDERRMNLRIGVNLGDVMVDGDNLLGDGVNVAARLEGVADPGGICISGDVYNQIRHKLSVSIEDMGPLVVRNIADPVPTFRITPGLVPTAGNRRHTQKPILMTQWRTVAITAAVVAAVALGAVALWQTLSKSDDPGPGPGNSRRGGMMRPMHEDPPRPASENQN
jgi:class 3 adenylate cyclase